MVVEDDGDNANEITMRKVRGLVTQATNEGSPGESAYDKAQKKELQDWREAAQVYGLSVEELKDGVIALSSIIGLATDFHPLAH